MCSVAHCCALEGDEIKVFWQSKKKVQSCCYAYLAPLDIVFIFLLQP